MVYYDCLIKKQIDKLAKLQKKSCKTGVQSSYWSSYWKAFQISKCSASEKHIPCRSTQICFQKQKWITLMYQPDAINELFKPQKELRHTRGADTFLKIAV